MRILKPFLCLLSLIVIIFSSCNTPPKKEIVEKSCSMKYRDLGNTGLKVSEIGIGCGCFEDKDTTFAREYITVAIDSGVNNIVEVNYPESWADLTEEEPVFENNNEQEYQEQNLKSTTFFLLD